jgi:hypothetical protein
MKNQQQEQEKSMRYGVQEGVQQQQCQQQQEDLITFRVQQGCNKDKGGGMKRSL